MGFDKSDYLFNVLETHKMKHIDSLFDKFKERRKEIKEKLEEKFGDDIYTTFNSGSYAKHTAVNAKFDLDIVAPCKRNSFSTITGMFDDFFDFLQTEYKEIAYVRKQKVSIGIEFFADEDNEVVQIDVVPGRELKQGDYPNDNYLNININVDGSNYTQTNIHAQIENIKGKSDARQIIRLLKIWKYQNYKDYKSFFIELIVIKAFENKIVSGSLWSKFKTVLEYIIDEIEEDNFSLKDPGNSSNDIAKTMDSYKKTLLKNDLKFLLDQVELNDENLKNHFKENEKFKFVEQSSESKGSYRVNDSSRAIIPPSNQFG